MTLLATLTALLLLATVRQWRKVRADDAPAAVRERAIVRVMDDAMNDDHRCGLCGEVSSIRELVTLHDDALVCCLACAPVLRPAREAA